MRQAPIHVSCAVIEKDGLILAVRRPLAGSMAGKWEFPGGKIEKGENAEECIKRELREELGVEAVISRSLSPVSWDYPEISIVLHPFTCDVCRQEIVLHEHEELIWDKAENLKGLDWADADVEVLEGYLT